MYYGKGNFCSLGCYNDWAEVFSDRAIDHFGRVTQPKVLTRDNAWSVRRDWNNDNRYAYNYLTEERRPLTQQQYDSDTTLTADGRLTI